MIWCLAAAIAVIIILSVKIYLLKKSAREIVDGFSDKLEKDTNTVIDISSRDKDMLFLADSINKQLKLLRKEHLQYHQGNTELKTAITNISHDIRTPLTAIYGYLDMLQQTDDPEKHKKYIAIMKERAELMKQLTEELFRYSVIVSEENEMQTESVNVVQVLEDSIMGYFAALNEKGIVPEVQLTEEAVIRELNKEYLARIFSNLLNNALKYSDGDLLIKLSAEGVITFTNTAKDLSAVEVEQLFDRFYTVEAAHHSTGLGLSIARTLVERMGGTITAEYADSKLTIRIAL
ncbi:histidine kinase [Ruminococcus albus SY3]|uniref:histidine kinase n=1 Tax=Ruminococcus albus SY3 TaxID=1341156 RepID=A0A011VS90_RUMAL|nr:HAMP domain-containing sensor histidine kinase [Ruminococcus albus]EXM37453.1 histidine kinase [Ruminococcus albus SY3]